MKLAVPGKLTKAYLMSKLVNEITLLQQHIIAKDSEKTEAAHKKIMELEKLIRNKW